MKTIAYNQIPNHHHRRNLKNKPVNIDRFNGIFDGEKIHLLEKVKGRRKSKVTITFGEELTDREISCIFPTYTQSGAFDFWKSSEEDIYQDYLKKKRKRK